MHSLAQKALEHVRRQELLKAGDRVGVAVSGGADSVALLRLLLELRKELGVVLSVVHFNHKLRGAESDADEEFVAQLAQGHKLDLHAGDGDVRGFAGQEHLSLEAAARKLRYGYFRGLLEEDRLSRIATAHTLDDQAETVLLRLARGAGTRGLAGIYPQLSVAGSQFSAIVRPLLAIRRQELEEYLRFLGQGWREDLSNRDLRFARNRVRHGILPRMERHLNPEVREALAETAEIARAEEEFWRGEATRALHQTWSAEQGMQVPELKKLPLALQRRVVRAAAESLGLRLEFRQVEEILEMISGKPEAAKSVALPGGWNVSRERNSLRFAPRQVRRATGYEYRLPIPGAVEVRELDTWIEAVAVSRRGEMQAYNPEVLLDPSRLSQPLIVRNWRAGDRFWPAHTKSPKKIKELLQQQHVSGAARQMWPVVVSEDKIIWVRGYPAPQQLRPGEGAEEAIVIRERVAAAREA